jgi:hypothetical protein
MDKVMNEKETVRRQHIIGKLAQAGKFDEIAERYGDNMALCAKAVIEKEIKKS